MIIKVLKLDIIFDFISYNSFNILKTLLDLRVLY